MKPGRLTDLVYLIPRPVLAWLLVAVINSALIWAHIPNGMSSGAVWRLCLAAQFLFTAVMGISYLIDRLNARKCNPWLTGIAALALFVASLALCDWISPGLF